MKLNFRSVDASTLSHGVTPILIPPPSTSSLPATAPRRWRWGFVYLVGAMIVLAMPFVIPVALSRAVGVVDRMGERNGRKEVNKVVEEVDKAVEEVKKERHLEPVQDLWQKYAVVRHGKLYLAETMEGRMNEEVVERLPRLYPNLFGECEERPHVSLGGSLKVPAWMELHVKCLEGSCLVRAHIKDLKSVWIEVREGKQFMVSGDNRWGPLEGEMRVGLERGGVLTVKHCNGTRVVNVDDVWQEVGKVVYGGVPRYHVV